MTYETKNKLPCSGIKTSGFTLISKLEEAIEIIEKSEHFNRIKSFVECVEEKFPNSWQKLYVIVYEWKKLKTYVCTDCDKYVMYYGFDKSGIPVGCCDEYFLAIFGKSEKCIFRVSLITNNIWLPS